MSWLARSIANTLSLNDADDDDGSDTVPNPNPNNHTTAGQQHSNDTSASPSSSTSPRGVKEDLSELTKTLTRQLWGVASFLAPPPQTEPYKPLNQGPETKGEEDNSNSKSGRNSDLKESDTIGISGIRSDLSEIGGKFKSGISKLSENINVSEITKMASNFLQLGDEDAEEAAKGTIGVTEEVVAFAKDIAMHPETWLDFPLPENEVEEDFDMSDAQQEHALAVERLAPRLAALRIELCPGYMSESCFWKIYFVLLHPRLDKEDAALLSTPQVMEARAFLAVELQKRTKAKPDNMSKVLISDSEGNPSSQHEESLSVPSAAPSEDASQKISLPELATTAAATDSETDKKPITSTEIPIVDKTATSSIAAPDSETDKHPITSTEIQIIDKSVIEVAHSNQNKDQYVYSGPSKAWEVQDEDDADDWLKEETSETGDASGTSIPIENEEDVSFSDLEDDDGDAPTSLKKVNYTSDKDSREWVQL